MPRVCAAFGLVLLAFVTALPAHAQSAASADDAAIRAVVQNYFDGMMSGSPETLRKAFDPAAVLIGPGQSGLTRIPFAQWSSGMTRPIQNPERHRNTIVSIDIAGNAAVVKTELLWPRVRYIDYLSLLKSNGEWRIVNKIWHQEAPPASTR